MLKGAIFDMDGLMIDTEKLYLKFWIQSAKDFGYDMKPEHVYAIRSMARKYSIPTLKGFLGEDCPTEEIRAHRTELMAEYINEHGLEVKKGLFELLYYLKGREIKMAVATATPRSRTTEYLEKIGAAKFFSAVICGDMVETGKPAPDIYLTAARELGLPPEECAAFEDSPNGIKAAHAAGCHAIMIPDMTQPDDEIKPLLSAVYENLGLAVDYFERSFGE
ncbi:HAD family hydrolase [Ruminococcus flavefaciens]|uniref:Haloacid dehalogenase superfamily, subfamily IA, variant 3 with third motif having DD or ED n=1 Tax=Ruminococcus flavefaciens TaxID=1265 RepID=A0A1K1Q0W6_RUMFL|nr:HAD family phosphatase [Ruminococcus flavefaciens]SFW53650.1 haloacid dehalogenase superfamily, subfamily IA, variant 3 with third motif having DD or ED [Ruminococcus flavefaciens]